MLGVAGWLPRKYAGRGLSVWADQHTNQTPRRYFRQLVPAKHPLLGCSWQISNTGDRDNPIATMAEGIITSSITQSISVVAVVAMAISELPPQLRS